MPVKSKKHCFFIVLIFFFFEVSVIAGENKSVIPKHRKDALMALYNTDSTRINKLKEEILAVYQSRGETGLRNFVKDKRNEITFPLIFEIADSAYTGKNKQWLKICLILTEEKKNEKAVETWLAITTVYNTNIPRNFMEYLLYDFLHVFAQMGMCMCLQSRERVFECVEKLIPFIETIDHPLARKMLIPLKTSIHAFKDDLRKVGKFKNIVKIAREYRNAGKYEKAQQHLEKALDEFPREKYHKRLKIELANVHLWWAKHLEKESDYTNAIKHYKKAYEIDKIYRPKKSAIELNNIGFLYYNAFDQKHEALGYFETELSIYRRIGDQSGTADSLHNIGNVYFYLDQNIKALEYYDKALRILRALGDQKGEATILNAMGFVYNKLGRKRKALGYYDKALPIWQATGDKTAEATTLSNIGGVYSGLGEKQKELEYYQKALSIFQGVADRAKEAIILNMIGRVYSYQGQQQKALEYHQKALSISRAVDDKSGIATGLNNIGHLYSDLGQKQEALDYYEKALPIFQALGDQVSEALILNNIASVYSTFGHKQKALGYLEKALPLLQAAGNQAGQAKTLNNIGTVYSDLGQKYKALEYYEKALLIRKAVGDRYGEVTTLTNIGAVYSGFGQKQKALKYYQKALIIIQEIGNRSQEANALNNIAVLYSELGQRQKTLEYLEKILQIIQSIGDKTREAATLNNIATLYSVLVLKQESLGYYEKALPINQTVGDRAGEATTLNNIGNVYSDLGEMHKALEYIKKALTILQAVGDRYKEAAALNNLGVVCQKFNQWQKALEYFKRALTIRHEVGDPTGESVTSGNIAAVYDDLGHKHKALQYYQEVLPIFQAVGNPVGEAAVLGNIGRLYYELGKKQNALDYSEKALSIYKNVGDRLGEAGALNNIGVLYSDLGRKQKVMEYYEKALPICKTIGYRDGEAVTLNNLMFYWNVLKNFQLSVYYGKQSVNIYQKMRSNISNLNSEIKRSYIESKKDTYRNLADILIKKGRLSEAQQVLDMLKEKEFFEFIRRDSSSAETLSTQVDFTLFEKLWIEKYNAVMKKMSSISSEYHLLKFKKNKNDPEKKRMKELELKIKAAQKAYEEFLVHLKKAFEKHEKEIKEGEIKPFILAKKASDLQNTLKYLDETEGGKNAALHYLVYEGRISVILTTPSSQSVKQTEIDEKKFNLMIINYRTLIMQLGKIKRGVQPLEISDDTVEKLFQKKKEYERKLYDAIFKPVDEELRQYGATNLVISLDGVLRYIPLPALWNGENYLVQEYRMALITPSSLRNIMDIPVKDKKILGMGASRGGQGFAPLPYVGREIRSIVRDEEKGYYGLIKGKAFIDKNFTKDTMVSQLKSKKYPLVHISSHFKFSPGDETKNHLLLGDGSTIKLSEIRRMGKLFDKVKLLVLSACQTGVGGNGEEIDGFGELAQQSGAKSVIASLWPVADESTKDLMVNFYSIMKEGKVTSKIEALRQAQLELAGLEDLLEKSNRQGSKKKSKYSHPYYWGPFIMIGNWR